METELSALSPKARAVLGRVAKGLPLYEGERSRDAVRRAVADLLRSGTLRRTGRGRYEIAERMLARHLRPGSA
jgi:hypothetical protein